MPMWNYVELSGSPTPRYAAPSGPGGGGAHGDAEFCQGRHLPRGALRYGPSGAGCPEAVVLPERRRHRGPRPLEEILHRYPLHAAGYAGGRCDLWIAGQWRCSTSARQPVRRPSSAGWTAAARRKKRTALWVEPESGSVSRSARASHEQDNYTRAWRLMQGGKDCHEQKN